MILDPGDIRIERLTPVSQPIDENGDKILAVFNALVGPFKVSNATLVCYRDGNVAVNTRDRKAEARCRIRLLGGVVKDALSAAVQSAYEHELAGRELAGRGRGNP